MNKESKRNKLVEFLKNRTPEMQRRLEILKKEKKALKRSDFIWHYILQSFATWGNSRGWKGLIADQNNYSRVTFDSLSKLSPKSRAIVILDVLRAAKVSRPQMKARLLSLNYELIVEMGGLRRVKEEALAQIGVVAKIAFMKRFYGIGDKYARNIWMDVYHSDFYDSIAVDERIKKITKALGYSFDTYAKYKCFYQKVAREANLKAWEVDRLLYNFTDNLLAELSSNERPPSNNGINRTRAQRASH